MRRLAAVALCAALTASCASRPPEYVEIQPECEVPPQPALPAIEGDELASLPDDVYWRLEDRERKIVDWALEMRGMLRELCSSPAEEQEAGVG